jgi:hypothetical protein
LTDPLIWLLDDALADSQAFEAQQTGPARRTGLQPHNIGAANSG